MLRNHALITSLLLETWYIDPAFADTMLPHVIELLEGKTVQNLTTQIHEKPLPSLLDSDLNHVVLAANESNSFGGFGSATAGSAAVLPIRGAITKYDGMCNYGVESYMQWIDEAERSPSIDTIVVLIDSPGGQANSAFMLAKRLADVKKPTLAYVDSGMATSAAYLIGSAADLFYVSTPVDMVGSIGAMITIQDYQAKLEGTKIWEVYSRLSTEKNEAFRRLREKGDTTLLEDMLDENVIHFINTVKTNRGDRLDLTAGDPFKGGTYLGIKGLTMGLLDGIDTLPNALTALRSQPKRIKVAPAPEAKLSTETIQNQNNTDMSLKTALINWLTDYKEEKPEATTETVTAVVEPVTPAAAVTTPAAPTLEERLAALESVNLAALSTKDTEITSLKAAIAAKPAAAPTAVVVANETVPSPVDANVETTSFLSETDELAAKLRSGQA